MKKSNANNDDDENEKLQGGETKSNLSLWKDEKRRFLKCNIQIEPNVLTINFETFNGLNKINCEVERKFVNK